MPQLDPLPPRDRPPWADGISTQLRALLRANRAIVEDIDLPAVLRRVVESAVELVDAEYGALGVIGSDGSINQFIHVGMEVKTADAIGHPPAGHGLLGAVIAAADPIRLRHSADDPRAIGFPASHPPMGSFLGVPIRVRDRVFGNLYLTNARAGHFTSNDEHLTTSLAATAGVAIENAHLFAETQLRQRWAQAAAETTAAILSSETDDVIGLVATRILDLAEADLVGIVFPTDDPDMLRIGVARGVGADAFEGQLVPARGSISASVIEGRQPRLLDSFPVTRSGGVPTAGGPALAVPLIAAARTLGVLVVTREVGRTSFTVADIGMVSDFADYVSVAMELSAARAAQQRMVLLEDRGRIARDLHDHVIQELFATGLDLHQTAGSLPSGPAVARIARAVDNLDLSISHIRTVIFALNAREEETVSVRHRILDLAHELAPLLARTPNISFAGPVDLLITGHLADDVLAVAREALTNIARHAHANSTILQLTAADGQILLEVRDDGHGFTDKGRRSGLANLEQRAENRSGTFTVISVPGDTRVRWMVPFSQPAAA
ncbi:GAF domain-containing sensor histidine kinase [Microbacterium hatanonis]|uniref:GAF domain-containing protein n=1 Tax=Microbacterium hatanonis TaxID=404366 RepID=A0A5C8I365_9MICO|nr:GAF domain-containing protein [Microbacterium hatanonis]TXK12333.1 GAF domain-containing protein [Microbacterium hatanonis]